MQKLLVHQYELTRNNFSLSQCAIDYGQVVVLCLRTETKEGRVINFIVNQDKDPRLLPLFKSIQTSLSLGCVPQVMTSGTSGGYFLTDSSHRSLGIFLYYLSLTITYNRYTTLF